MVKAQTACPSQRVADVLRRVRQVYAEYQLDLRDGVKVLSGKRGSTCADQHRADHPGRVGAAPTAAARPWRQVFELVGSMI